MTWEPDEKQSALIALGWQRASAFVAAWVARLDLGLVGTKPFLPRVTLSALRRELILWEAIVRRMLILCAKNLPAIQIKPRATHAKPVARQFGETARQRAPQFKLTEPVPRSVYRLPQRKGPVPRILSLDEPYPGPWQEDAIRHPEDMLAAGRIVRRLRALQAVFDRPDRYIRLAQRRLAGFYRQRAGASQLYLMPPSIAAKRLPKADRDTLLDLHCVLQDSLAPP